jgi:hypothetical protein
MLPTATSGRLSRPVLGMPRLQAQSFPGWLMRAVGQQRQQQSPYAMMAMSGGNGGGGPTAGSNRAGLPSGPGGPSSGLLPGDPSPGYDPGGNPIQGFDLPPFEPFVPPLGNGFGPIPGVTPGSPMDPYSNPGGEFGAPGMSGRSSPGRGFNEFPIFTSPLGTQYANVGGTWINPQGIPRATAVDPSQDPYGLGGPAGGWAPGSGGPAEDWAPSSVGGIGPQSVAGAAPTGPPMTARYI